VTADDGHRSAGISTARSSVPAVTSERIHIDADAATVWQVMVDVGRWSEWTDSVSSTEVLDVGPLAAGHRVRIKQPGFPAATWTVTDVVPKRSFTWANRSPGMTSVATHAIDAAPGGGVDVTLAIEQTGLLAGPVKALMKKRTARYVRMEAEGLKARAEAGGG
jgi:hypothetical protein